MSKQKCKTPVQAFIMSQLRALNVQSHTVGNPVLDWETDSSAALLGMLDMCEARNIELKAFIPELLETLSEAERKAKKSWAPAAIRELIAANPDTVYNLVVWDGGHQTKDGQYRNYGPELAVLADTGGSTQKNEVVQIGLMATEEVVKI